MNQEERIPIPLDALAMDAKLESQATQANMDLYRHRWHWTLNPDNPHRVSFGAYAQAVGRSMTNIRMQARGYAAWIEDPDMPIREHIERANMSAQRAVVIDAIARTYNLSFSSARRDDGGFARDVEIQAKVKMEQKNIPFEQAVEEVVAWHQQADEARRKERKKIQDNHGMRYVAVENEITKARNALAKALNVSHEVEFSDKEREILGESIRRLSATVSLLDMAVTGTIAVDWDAELKKLGVA